MIAIAPEDDYSSKLVELGCDYYPINFPGTGMDPIKDFGLFIKMLKVLRKAKPDMLLTYTIKPNIYGSIISGILGIPCICNVSGLGTVFLWKGSLKRIAVSLYAFAFRFNKWVFFQNEEDQKDFTSLVPLKQPKTSILPGSGVDLSHFQLVPFRNQQPITFLMISRLIIDKGVIEFMEAADMVHDALPKVRFVVLGGYDSGHARSIDPSTFKNLSNEGGPIVWHDHVEDARPFIEQADVVVLPSYREGTPKTLLEAGAMGKALIATDVPGCRQVVQDGYNGFLCKVKNAKDLATKIRLYLSLSVEERNEMHMNARKLVETKYDEQFVVSRYAEKIEELTKKS